MARITDDSIDLRRYIAAAKRYKWIYIATFVVIMTGAIYFYATREPKYDMYAKIMIEHDDGNNMIAGMSQLTRLLSLGNFGGGVSVDNELFVLQSRTVLRQTVKELKLNQKYFLKKGFMHKQTLYGDSPLLIVTDEHRFDSIPNGNLLFKISLKETGKADVSVIKGVFETIYEENDIDLPSTLTVEGIPFTLLPTNHFVKGESQRINAAISSIDDTVEKLAKEIKAESASMTSDIIILNYETPNLQLGKDVLNTLIAKYNDQRLIGKDMKADRGTEFIDKQLETVYSDLVASDTQLEKFKSENKLTDISAEMSVLLESSSKLTESILEMRSQVMMCDLMLKYLKSEDSKYSIVPTTSNTGDAGNEVVLQYNDLVLQRIKLQRSAKPDNVALAEATAAIDAMRNVVVESVEQQKKNCEVALETLEGQYAQFTSRLDSAPKVEREFIEISRENVIQNELYLLLLSKKAEFQINISALSVPGFVVDEAYPIENLPSRSKAFLIVGLLFSLILPSLYVLFKLWRDNSVYREYDMPLEIKKNSDFAVCDDMPSLRSAILSKEVSKIIPLLYGSGMHKDAIIELCQRITNTGKRVLLIDLDNITKSSTQLRDLKNSTPTSLTEEIDCMGYDGNVGDMLLNDHFKALLQTLSEKYDKIILAAHYSEDVFTSIKDIDETVQIFYLATSGKTKRKEVAHVAEYANGHHVVFGIV